MLRHLLVLIAALFIGSLAQAGDPILLTYKNQNIVFSNEAHSAFKKSRLARSSIKKLIVNGMCDPDESGLTHLDLDQMFACVVKNSPANFIIFSRYNGETSFMQTLREGQPTDAYFVELLTSEFSKKIEEATLYLKPNGGGNRKPIGGPRSHLPAPYVTRKWYKLKLIGDTNPAEFRIIEAELREIEMGLKELNEELQQIDGEIKRLVDTGLPG